MKEFKWYNDSGMKLMHPVSEGFKFLGGKADDITVTVAQIFTDEGKNDPRRHLSANDTYYKE